MEEERERLLRFAYFHFKKGELATAYSFCEQVLSKCPNDPEAFELMGDIRMEQARWQDARDFYQIALRFNPSRKEIAEKLARVERKLRELEKDLSSYSSGDVYVGGRTSLGMAENIEGFLCYLFPAIFPIIVLLLERESRFARFHAIQSLLFSALAYVLRLPLEIILALFQSSQGTSSGSVAFYILNTIFGGIIFLIWIWLAYGALQGQINKLPWLGDLAEKWANL